MVCMHALSWQLWTTILALKESNREPKVERYKTVYSKVTLFWVAPKIIKEKEKAFINDILEVLFTAGITEEPLQLEDTPKNIATVPFPGKKEVIASHSSRFLLKNLSVDIAQSTFTCSNLTIETLE